jgi:hypothetical protein
MAQSPDLLGHVLGFNSLGIESCHHSDGFDPHCAPRSSYFKIAEISTSRRTCLNIDLLQRLMMATDALGS